MADLSYKYLLILVTKHNETARSHKLLLDNHSCGCVFFFLPGTEILHVQSMHLNSKYFLGLDHVTSDLVELNH